MKKVIRISKFFVLSGIISLLFSISASSQTNQDSCRILVEDYDKTIVENPDSVMIDTCQCPDVHWSECKYLYAKQWYEILFPIGAVDLPSYPADTIIYITLDNIDSNFTELRQKLFGMYNIFGNYTMQKVYPEISDSLRSGSRYFIIKFDDYSRIDSVERYLREISNVKVKYLVRYGPHIVEIIDQQFQMLVECQIEIYPNPASEYIEISFLNQRFKSLVNVQSNIQIYNVFGVQMVVGEHCPDIIGMPLRIDISYFPNGLYFLRIADEVQKFVVLR